MEGKVDKKSFVLIQMQKKIALVLMKEMLMKEIFSYYPADSVQKWGIWIKWFMGA